MACIELLRSRFLVSMFFCFYLVGFYGDLSLINYGLSRVYEKFSHNLKLQGGLSSTPNRVSCATTKMLGLESYHLLITAY